MSERRGWNRCTGIQQQQYSSSMYKYVVESRAPQSTTQHSSAITPAQRSKQPSTCRSEYVSKVCSYMHASRLFSWSMELLAVASRRFARKILGRLLTTSLCQFNPFFLASERSGRKPPATRSALVHTKKRPSSLSFTENVSNSKYYSCAYRHKHGRDA